VSTSRGTPPRCRLYSSSPRRKRFEICLVGTSSQRRKG